MPLFIGDCLPLKEYGGFPQIKKESWLLSQQNIRQIVELCEEANRLVMTFFHTAASKIDVKADQSPVTDADVAANNLIVQALQKITPNIPIISEETAVLDYQIRQKWPQCWLIDPIDGTKEFIARRESFTVNMGLIVGNQAVFGVVGKPVTGEVFYGQVGQGAFLKEGAITTPINVRQAPESGATVLVSSQYLGGQIKSLQEFNPDWTIRGIASSIKFCVLACGNADLYIRKRATSEWDTAAGDAILAAAGGKVLDFEGQPLIYNKPNLENPSFVATASTDSDYFKKITSYIKSHR